MSSGITWTTDTLTPGVATFGPRLLAAVSAVVDRGADQCENYMRTNAPWTDRTSNARNGLFARTFAEERQAGARGANGRFLKKGTTFTIVCYHSVPYGLWLEVRWSGKYRIIVPTIQTVGPQIMSMLDRVIGSVT